jgi:hypothetical protein
MVISSALIPPASIAFASANASSKEDALNTGSSPVSPMRFRTSTLFIALPSCLSFQTEPFQYQGMILSG